MSFYDSASLAFLPSGGAGKDGKAYSIKPVPEYGNELVTNGGFDTNSDWTFIGSANIANGVVNFITVGDFVIQSNVVSLSVETYKIQYEVVSSNNGQLRFAGGNSAFPVTTLPSSVGVHTVIVVSNGTQGSLQFNSNGFIGSIDNVSVKEVIVDGDFTFSRGSNLTATRVDSNGLIEKGRENLLVNSVWDGVSTDTKPTGWSNQFVSGTGTFDVTATEGQIRFQTLDASSRAFIYSPTITTNGIVVASVYVDEVTTAIPLSNLLSRSANATDLFAYEDGVEINYSDNVQAGKRYSVVFNKTASTNFRFGVGVSSGTLGDVVLSRPQIEVGLVATEWITSPIGSTGKAEILEDSPRFDYSGGASCPSLLLEPSRTNLVKHSEYIGSLYSEVGTDVTDNATQSPSGTNDAALIYEESSNNSHWVQTDVTTSSSTTYTQSAFVKKKDSGIYASLRTNGVGANSYIIFDFDTATIVDEGSDIISSGVVDYSNGWYRIYMTYTKATISFIAGITNSTTNPIPSYLGTGKGYYLWGLQIEEGSYPTSYIPNHSGGSVTRNAENCSGAGNSSTFNDTEGVLYAEIAAIADDQTSKVISLSDGTFDERVLISTHTGGSNQIRVFIKSGGSFSATIDVILNDITDYNKIAYRYKSGETKLFVNGSLISTSTDTFSISGLNALQFASGTSTAVPFYGNAKQVIVFNTALSDTDLEILTGTSYESFAAMATALNYTTYE